MGSSGVNHGMARVGAGGERGGGDPPSPSAGRTELASEGSFAERRHGREKGSAVAAKQRGAASAAEEMGETTERKDTGHAHAHNAVGDYDDDDDDEDDDEPVIVWTPVVEYRGSLSYWTVQLTGWRTETATDGSNTSSTSDVVSTAAMAGGRWQRSISNLSAADGQDGGGHTATTAGITITAGPEMCPEGCQAIVDTGSSLLVPPRGQYREVMKQIIGGRADCRYRYGMTSCSECGSPDDFPDIVVSVAVAPPPGHGGGAPARRRPMKSAHGDGEVGIINNGGKHNRRRTGGVGGSGGGGSRGGGGGGGGGGRGTGWFQEFRLKPSDYLSQSWDGCEVLIGEGRATDIWTLGDAFIKTYMTIFDVANLRVGFVCPDGGRCLGGNPAAAPWRPATHFCWPFPGRSTVDQDSADRLGGTYCLYLHFSFLGWALMATSVLLFVVGCLFAAHERSSSDGGATSLVAVPSLSPSEQQNNFTLSNPPLPLLFTARPECRCQQQQLQQQQPRSRWQEKPALVEDDAEAVRGGNGRSGGGPRSPVGDGMAAPRRKTPEKRHDCRQPGGGSEGGIPLRWAQGSKDILLPFAGRSAAVAGWVVSLAAAATNARQQWLSPRDGRRRKA
ncbi:unnamed protein product [Ectocarpus sp. CCAP 1310/34]|nr:unnamed protein product [Ectocarpus sp. CCAP 1310/34]